MSNNLFLVHLLTFSSSSSSPFRSFLLSPPSPFLFFSSSSTWKKGECSMASRMSLSRATMRATTCAWHQPCGRKDMITSRTSSKVLTRLKLVMASSPANWAPKDKKEEEEKKTKKKKKKKKARRRGRRRQEEDKKKA